MRGAPRPALLTGAALLTSAQGRECLQTLFMEDTSTYAAGPSDSGT